MAVLSFGIGMAQSSAQEDQKDGGLKPQPENNNVNRAQTILSAEKYIAPSSKFGNKIRFKKPSGAKDVEIRTIFDEWGNGYMLTPNAKDPNIVEIDIKEMKLPEGRYEFKFIIDGEFEGGYNRVLWIDDKELLVEPKSGRAILREESHNNEILSFLDNNHTFLEITHSGDDWKTRTPLKFEKPYWDININDLNLPPGTHRFKLIRDGDIEQGADRLLHVSEEDPKKVIIKDPRKTKVIKEDDPKNVLKAINPNTTYLALKSSADNWEKEYIMEEKDGIWEIDIEKLNLPKNEEKTHEFKFATSEGLESGENRKLYVDEKNNLIFPKPWTPVIVKTKKPSSILYFKSQPNQKIELVSSADGWSKRFETKPVKNHKGIFSINTKDLGLPEGKTPYKFVIDGEFEGGADRLLWIDGNGKIYEPEPKGPVVWDGFEPYPSIRIQDDQITSLTIKHSGDGWNTHIPFEVIDGIWQLDISKLNLPPGVYEYKLERDFNLEVGVNRILNIVEDNKHSRLYPQSPETIQPKSPSPLLIVNDPNTKYLAIKHEQDKWEKEYPFKQIETNTLEVGKFVSPIKEGEKDEKNRKTIKFKKPKGAGYVEIRALQDDWKKGYALNSGNNKTTDILELDISKMKLKEGKLEYKFVIDGEFEAGPNRFVWIDDDGLMAETQTSVQGRESLWALNTKEIGLTPGRIEYKLVTSDGMEPFGNRILHISEEGNLQFPLPETPFILNKATPDKKIKILAPNNPDIGISHSGDNWEKTYKLTRSGDIWTTSNKELQLAPGQYEFKIRIGDGDEPGEKRKLTVTEDREFLFIDPESLNIDPEVALIKINAPGAQSLQLRYRDNWERAFPFEKNEGGEWILDSRTLGIPKNTRVFFKIIIDEKLEESPDRAGYINNESKFIVEKPPVPEAVTTSDSLLTREDNYFGSLREIKPDPNLSLKAKAGWYNSASIYHIWVPAFKDSELGSLAKDKIGDLRGITEVIKSGYFKKLGIEALWLSPIFQSGDETTPKDGMHGYETKDFYQINKNLGTKEDFLELLKEAHKEGIRVVLEFVPNHVGNSHPWFIASNDPSHPNHEEFKDWFIWKENPIEEFSLKAWHKDPLWTKSKERGEYYYHIFSGYLPDLNYRNPKVIQEIANVAIYWLNLGVDGFRVDANKYLFENFNNIDSGAHNQPETIEFYQELSRIIEEYAQLDYPKVMIAENWTYNANEIELYGQLGDKKSFDLSLDFMLPHIIKWSTQRDSADWIANHINDDQPKNIKYLRFLTNHDVSAPRAKSNYERARKLATNLNILLPGPYIIYYGEEIDLEGNTTNTVRNPFDWGLTDDKNIQLNIDGLNLEDTSSRAFEVYKGDPLLEIGKTAHPLKWIPKDRKTIRFKKPKKTESVGIKSNNDGWQQEFKLEPISGDINIMEIDISKLNLKEGRTDFNFVLDGIAEAGPRRHVWIDDQGVIAETQLSTLEEYQEVGQLRQKHKEFFESLSSKVITSQDKSKILIKYALEGRELIIIINIKDEREYASIFAPKGSVVRDAKTDKLVKPLLIEKEETTEELEFKFTLPPYGMTAVILDNNEIN